MNDRVEVCPLSRGVLSQLLFDPLQVDFRFFHLPLPATLLVHLAMFLPLSRELTGLPCCVYITV